MKFLSGIKSFFNRYNLMAVLIIGWLFLGISNLSLGFWWTLLIVLLTCAVYYPIIRAGSAVEIDNKDSGGRP